MNDVLAGIRVLDFCWVGAGSLVTKLLAEHGAEVIKVESRARPDNVRVSPPFRPGADGLDASGYFASRNNDKQSFALNMRDPRARELAQRLAAKADVVTNNYRPGVMERWGLGYDDLSARNPSLVYLAMPMQGAEGPHASYIGFGTTIAALAGIVELSGRADRGPVGTGTQYPDHVPSPAHALVALLAALRRRRATGEGCRIEMSQFESAVRILGPALAATAAGAPVPMRNGNRVPHQSPSGVFPCTGEDEWCAIAARDDAEWAAAAAVLGVDGWATFAERKADEDALEQAIATKTCTWDARALADALEARGVPASPVLASKALLADDHLRARSFWRTLDHPVLGPHTLPSAPFTVDGERTGPERGAPLLGEHTREVARSLLGLDDAEVDALEAERVLW